MNRTPEQYLTAARQLLADEMGRPDPDDGIEGWCRLFVDAEQLAKWLAILPGVLPPGLDPPPASESVKRIIREGRAAELSLDSLQTAAFDFEFCSDLLSR